ncbi:MAG: hypothetical protein FWG03_00155 [Clostridiales bacterium]|nr:hypothetical protein [Clostridiales bacterium]
MKTMRIVAAAIMVLCVLVVMAGCKQEPEHLPDEPVADPVEAAPDSADDPVPPEQEEPDEPEVQEEESLAKDTVMRAYDFGSVQAEVGYNAEFNIYVNFEPGEEDKRIYFKQSGEGACEWLLKGGVNESSMFTIQDSSTGKELYLLHFFYAGAPWGGNDIFLFDADPAMLLQELSSLVGTIETTATVTKDSDDGYQISFPEYKIDGRAEFSDYGDGWLKELRGDAQWGTFTIDVPIFTKNIDEVFFTDKTITEARVVFADNDYENWIPDFYFITTYEIRNGVLTPTKRDIMLVLDMIHSGLGE